MKSITYVRICLLALALAGGCGADGTHIRRVSCHVARKFCQLADGACTALGEPGQTSGGEATAIIDGEEVTLP